jgi:hypothetical protein
VAGRRPREDFTFGSAAAVDAWRNRGGGSVQALTPEMSSPRERRMRRAAGRLTWGARRGVLPDDPDQPDGAQRVRVWLCKPTGHRWAT